MKVLGGSLPSRISHQPFAHSTQSHLSAASARNSHGSTITRGVSSESKEDAAVGRRARRPWDGGVPSVDHLIELVDRSEVTRTKYGGRSDHGEALALFIWEAYSHLRIAETGQLRRLDRKQWEVILDIAAQSRAVRKERSTFVRMVVKDAEAFLGLDLGILKYNAEILALRGRKGAVQDSLDLLENAKRAGHLPTMDTYNALLQVRISAEGTYRGERWWSSVEGVDKIVGPNGRKVTVQRNVDTMNNILYGLIAEGRMEDGLKYFRNFNRANLTPNLMTWAHILRGHISSNNYEGVATTLDGMRSAGLEPNYHIYFIAIDGLLRIRSHEETSTNPNRLQYCSQKATELYDEMRSRGFQPGLWIYNTFINKHLRDGDVEKVISTFQEMESADVLPDLQSYTNLIKAHIMNADLREAQKVFDAMIEAGVEADTAVYGILMFGYDRFGRSSRAIDVYEEMISKGLESNKVIYHTVLSAYCKMGNMEAAYATVKEMEEKGLRAEDKTYWILMRGHALCGDLQSAEELFERIPPTTRGYNIIMAACVQCARGFVGSEGNMELYDRALRYYADMCAKGIEPNVVTFSILVNTKAKALDVAGAKEVLKTLMEKTGTMSGFAITPLIWGNAMNGQVDEAVEFYHFFKDREAEFVDVPPEELKPRGLDYLSRVKKRKTNEMASNSLLLAYSKAQDVQSAIRHFRTSDAKPDAIAYDILVRAHGAVGDVMGARAWLEEALEKNIPVTTRLWNSMLTVCVRGGDTKGAFTVLEDMQRRGYQPDMFTYTLVLKAKLAEKAEEKEKMQVAKSRLAAEAWKAGEGLNVRGRKAVGTNTAESDAEVDEEGIMASGVGNVSAADEASLAAGAVSGSGQNNAADGGNAIAGGENEGMQGRRLSSFGVIN
ncbi:hypothetical protein HDV00_002549 [Rhizophlyctis rosea]|nr:hypothetical protein HDV00_002549 [Rhizophlyctis rosea]